VDGDAPAVLIEVERVDGAEMFDNSCEHASRRSVRIRVYSISHKRQTVLHWIPRNSGVIPEVSP
jgi:hypothetical protein